jgi:hypothetical protein
MTAEDERAAVRDTVLVEDKFSSWALAIIIGFNAANLTPWPPIVEVPMILCMVVLTRMSGCRVCLLEPAHHEDAGR